MRRSSLLTLLFSVFLLVPRVAAGQVTPYQRIVDRLTGGNEREWIFQAFDEHLGSDDSCREGESYRFKTNNTVEIEKCVNRRIVRTQHRWHLALSSTGKAMLTIGSDTYQALLYSQRDVQLLRLRKTSPRRPDLTIDKVLRYEQY